jgi:hypothetical protein
MAFVCLHQDWLEKEAQRPCASQKMSRHVSGRGFLIFWLAKLAHIVKNIIFLNLTLSLSKRTKYSVQNFEDLHNTNYILINNSNF